MKLIQKTHKLPETLPDGRIGIIDIGSNSIRLVVYDAHKRSPVSIYNEKVMCALGKGLAASGVLNPQGVEMAKSALRRFIAMGRNMQISVLHVMATAAIRDASDGADFTRWVEETHNVKVDVISGKEEARLGAFAICSTIHRPQGITADLGGGSLELVRIDDDKTSNRESLPLGSLRLLDESKGDRDKITKIIDKNFAKISWLDAEKTPNIYPIGGSFRALAKMHMEANNYTVDTKKFLVFLREISAMSVEKLEKSAGKRASALTGAAMVLEKLITQSKPEQIVFSASGIREGYVYDKLNSHQRGEDGLIASCSEFAARGGRNPEYASELFAWMQPLFPIETEQMRRLRRAFCFLSDIAIHIHPEYRAEWAFQRIIYSAFTSINHRERVCLALALYHRYKFKLKQEFSVLKLVSDDDRKWANLLGATANLAYHLSGSITGNLPKAALKVKGRVVSLQFEGDMADIMGDSIQKRIDSVNEAMKNVPPVQPA